MAQPEQPEPVETRGGEDIDRQDAEPGEPLPQRTPRDPADWLDDEAARDPVLAAALKRQQAAAARGHA